MVLTVLAPIDSGSTAVLTFLTDAAMLFRFNFDQNKNCSHQTDGFSAVGGIPQEQEWGLLTGIANIVVR